MHANLHNEVHEFLRKFHVGRHNSIIAAELAKYFDTSVRDINEAIRQLRKSGILVGSAKETPCGYYIPANLTEAEEHLNTFRSELFDMLHTYNHQKRLIKKLIKEAHEQDLFAYRDSRLRQLELVGKG